MIVPKVLDLLAIEVPIITIKLRTFGAAISIAAMQMNSHTRTALTHY
jgi:hypothetical protein